MRRDWARVGMLLAHLVLGLDPDGVEMSPAKRRALTNLYPR